MHMFGENSSYVTIINIFKLDRSDQNWMETLKMAPLFQGNTTTIEAPFKGSGCSRVV